MKITVKALINNLKYYNPNLEIESYSRAGDEYWLVPTGIDTGEMDEPNYCIETEEEKELHDLGFKRGD